ETVDERRAEPFPGGGRTEPHADQQRRRASDHRREDQQTAADRIREIGHGGDHEEQEEDQTRGAEHADPAIAHDGETLRLIPPGEPVQDVGEPIEVDAAGHRLPGRDQEGRGQERREESLKDSERAGEAYAQQEADDREPPRGAAERGDALPLPPGYRHHGQESDRQDQRPHAWGTAAATPLRRAGRDYVVAGTRAAWIPRRRDA